MPLRQGCKDEDIQANIATLIGEGKSPDEAAAIAYNMCNKTAPTVKAIQAGSLIKAVTDTTFEGYLVRYGNEEDTDLDGEWFSDKTYFMRKAGYPIKGAPVNYQHGMEPDFGAFGLGLFNMVDEDEIGLFVQGQQHTRAEYLDILHELGRVKGLKWSSQEMNRRAELAQKAVHSLVHSVPLQFSMGADIAAFVVNSETKHIDQCGIVHGALTPTPADDKNPLIQFKSAIRYILTPDSNITYSIPNRETVTSGYVTSQESPVESESEASQNTVQSHSDTNIREDNEMTKRLKMLSSEEAEAMRQSLMAWLDDTLAQMGMEADDTMMAEMTDEMEDKLDKQDDMSEEGVVEEAAAAIATEVDAESEGGEVPVTEAVVEQIVADNLEEILPDEVKKYMAKQAQQEKNRKSRVAETLQHARENAPANSHKARRGGYATEQPARISVEEERKYAHLTAEQMALGLKIVAAANYPFGMPPGIRMEDIVKSGRVSEGYIRTMTHKAGAVMQRDGHFQQKSAADTMMLHDRIALKSAMPFKADELDAVAITNQGAEWAFIFYDTRLWERARHETQLFNMLTERGMRTADVTGKTMNVKLNTGSPTVYTAPEGQSLDASGRPEVVVQTTPFTTDEVAKDVKKHMLASAFTDELDEDSIIAIQSFLDEDVMTTLAEALEDALNNGDTTTTTSNINTDGTPATGIQTPLYIAWDGLRHNWLVDNTDQSNAKGSALVLTDYEDTILLLDATIVNRRQNMIFVIDYKTESATRKLPEVLTDDVKQSGGTAFAGQIGELFSVPVYMSGFMRLSQADGTQSATSSSNTKGTIECVYAPYWQYGRKREVQIELERYAQSSATVVVASVRHILAARGANAAAGTYNITV